MFLVVAPSPPTLTGLRLVVPLDRVGGSGEGLINQQAYDAILARGCCDRYTCNFSYPAHRPGMTKMSQPMYIGPDRRRDIGVLNASAGITFQLLVSRHSGSRPQGSNMTPQRSHRAQPSVAPIQKKQQQQTNVIHHHRHVSCCGTISTNTYRFEIA